MKWTPIKDVKIENIIKEIKKPRSCMPIVTKKQMKKTCQIEDCVYPDWEGGFSTGKHNFDKDGFCTTCGKTKEQI
jgi:hypothetical protein